MTDTRPKIYFGKYLPLLLVQQTVYASISFLVFVVARVGLRADWKINRDHRARLVSSNRDWFAYYTNMHTFFIRIRGEDYNASSGFGLWAKTLRGQKNCTTFNSLRGGRLIIKSQAFNNTLEDIWQSTLREESIRRNRLYHCPEKWIWGYRVKHQPAVRTGFEPATYQSQIRRSNHSATLPPWYRSVEKINCTTYISE